jgi:hypothetical protein
MTSWPHQCARSAVVGRPTVPPAARGPAGSLDDAPAVGRARPRPAGARGRVVPVPDCRSSGDGGVTIEDAPRGRSTSTGRPPACTARPILHRHDDAAASHPARDSLRQPTEGNARGSSPSCAGSEGSYLARAYGPRQNRAARPTAGSDRASSRPSHGPTRGACRCGERCSRARATSAGAAAQPGIVGFQQDALGLGLEPAAARPDRRNWTCRAGTGHAPQRRSIPRFVGGSRNRNR